MNSKQTAKSGHPVSTVVPPTNRLIIARISQKIKNPILKMKVNIVTVATGNMYRLEIKWPQFILKTEYQCWSEKEMKYKEQTTLHPNRIYLDNCSSYNSIFNEELLEDVRQVHTFLCLYFNYGV